MSKLVMFCLILGLLGSPVYAQSKKVIKPKPEKEVVKKGAKAKQQNKQQKNPIMRSKLQRPPLHNTGGFTVHAFANKYMGFGAQYGRSHNNKFGWTVQFQYFTVPSDQFYFDPYYYQFVQRNRGSMLMLTVSSKLSLPILRNEPNINPHWIIGGGPVLGIQSDMNRTFPGSITHAYSLGGFTAYTGPGLSYYISSWFLNFDLYYQILRFPNEIFGESNFDGVMFALGIGKMF